MNKRDIKKLDIDKLNNKYNNLNIKSKKTNIIYTTLGVLTTLTIIMAISNTSNKAVFIISLILAIGLIIPTIIYSKKLNNIKEEKEEIEYYINQVKINQYEENFINQFSKDIENKEIKIQNSKYHIKTKSITDNEKYFLNIIKKHFGKDYDIRVQVPLSSIIEKEKEFEREYQNELNRIIDIGIFDKETSYPLLLIEINDPTHKRKDRQIRDAKIKNICEQAGIKIIAFWTEYSNNEEYIFNQINTNLGDSK